MRDRTADLLNANQALSQLSYSPIYFRIIISKSLFEYVNLCLARRGFMKHSDYANKDTTKQNANLVGLGRLELPTSPLSGVRSNQLSYRPIMSRPGHSDPFTVPS